jgi:hypothetical protein
MSTYFLLNALGAAYFGIRASMAGDIALLLYSGLWTNVWGSIALRRRYPWERWQGSIKSVAHLISSLAVAPLLMLAIGLALMGADNLADAARQGNMAQVRYLVQMGVSPNQTDYEGHYTPLIQAAMSGQEEVVHYLVLKAGADVNYRIPDSPLTAYVCAKGYKHLKIADFLKAQGAVEEPVPYWLHPHPFRAK